MASVKSVSQKLYVTIRTAALLVGLSGPCFVVVAAAHDVVAHDTAERCLKQRFRFEKCNVLDIGEQEERLLIATDTWQFHRYLNRSAEEQNAAVVQGFFWSLLAFTPLLVLATVRRWFNWIIA